MHPEKLGFQILERMSGSGIKGASEGIISGAIRPLKENETRMDAMVNDALNFAVIGSLTQGGKDVGYITKESLKPITDKIGNMALRRESSGEASLEQEPGATRTKWSSYCK